ncbi:ATP-dependent Lon protease [Nitrobacteraceae bacterium AZCC 2161]
MKTSDHDSGDDNWSEDSSFVADDVASSGAAADSSMLDDHLKALPRLLRYAILSTRENDTLRHRVMAEVRELCPDLPELAIWIVHPDLDTALALAAALDQRAVCADQPDLRSLADSVRLVALPMPRDLRKLREHQRLAKALLLANEHLPVRTDAEVAANIEAFCWAFAALPVARELIPSFVGDLALDGANHLATRIATKQLRNLKDRWNRQIDKEQERQRAEQEKEQASVEATTASAAAEVAASGDHLLVCRIDEAAKTSPKTSPKILAPYNDIIGAPLPLRLAPPLYEVRSRLLFEFPYAEAAIDFALGDLVGRRTVHLRPLLLVGEPGGGKSRFVRRLGEVLGIHVWRTDVSRSDGAVFGGTDKRWYSAEPCHPLLAIAQARHANPMVLLDELEKAGTRSDYGRLWDCLLGFLEGETAARYPDPALQITLDLSQVSYVATANSLDSLPPPLRDRFRVIAFPKPRAADLDALLPAVLADLAGERRLDPRWMAPLSGDERDLVAHHWRGGSVRQLRRILEVVLRARDQDAVRN